MAKFNPEIIDDGRPLRYVSTDKDKKFLPWPTENTPTPSVWGLDEGFAVADDDADMLRQGIGVFFQILPDKVA